MRKLLVLVLLAPLLNSCMLKSVMKDEADDISKASIYNFDGKEYLVMMETVYQATSKRSGRGISVTTGYNEQRLSIYDLRDGSLKNRIKTGKQIRQAVEFLGCTNGKLWFYSLKEGIHARDPETLEINVPQETIFGKNPEIRDKLATCEWYELPKYFQFNDISRKIVLTDNRGYRYLLDPDSLTTQKVTWEYQPFDPRSSQQLETSIPFPPPYLNLTGELRQQIRVENREVNPGLTFLKGQFIIDRNPARILESVDRRLSGEMVSAEAVYRRIMDLNALNNGRGPDWRSPGRDTLRMLESLKYKLDNEITKLEGSRSDVQAEGYSYDYKKLLSPDTTSFLMFHSSGTPKEANTLISRVMLENSQLKELWKTEIPGLFFDPNAARETDPFKMVFSKGSPEFDFSQFDLSGHKMIIIRMLHVHCIDMETGHILWKFRV